MFSVSFNRDTYGGYIYNVHVYIPCYLYKVYVTCSCTRMLHVHKQVHERYFYMFISRTCTLRVHACKTRR